MTLFLVNYLQELKKRGSPLLPDSQIEIVKWFAKNRPSGANVTRQINTLFNLKNEIPLAEPAFIQGLAASMHQFFMNEKHKISPFVNTRNITPDKFHEAVTDEEHLGSIVSAMVSAACMEILDNNGEIKKEIIDRLQLAEYTETAENKKILRDRLIFSYVDGVLLKSMMRNWLDNKTAQQEILVKSRQLNYLPVLIKLIPSLIGDAQLKNVLLQYTATNPKLSMKTKDGMPTKALLEKLSNFILDRLKPAPTAKAREKLYAELISAMNGAHNDVMVYLTNHESSPGVFFDRTVFVLSPELIHAEIKKINQHGMQIANNFQPTEFSEFIKARVNDRGIHISRILNDDPVVFPKPEVVDAADGESLLQLKAPFNELLQINNEMHDFIKQWVAAAFDNLLTEEGHFNQKALAEIYERNRFNVESLVDEQQLPGRIMDGDRLDKIRGDLLLAKMEAVLSELIKKHPDKVNDAFIKNLKKAMLTLHPDALAVILQMPMLSEQVKTGNLNESMLDAFRFLQFSAPFQQPSSKPQAVSESNAKQKIGDFANSVVSAFMSFSTPKVEAKAEAKESTAAPIPAAVENAFTTLLTRHLAATNQPDPMVIFVNKLIWLTGAQIFDERGNVRKNIKQFDKKIVDINACTDSLRKVLINMIAESDAAKEFYLRGIKSENLEKLLMQIPEAIGLYCNEAINALEKNLPINNVNTEKFYNTMGMTCELFDMNGIMEEVEKKVKENVLPFQKSSIEELQSLLHQILMNKDSLQPGSVDFQKFITNLTLFGFAEVLDEEGNVKLAGGDIDDETRVLLLSAYLRKTMITITLGWMGNEKYQSEFKATKTHSLALDNTVVAIEAALNKGLSRDTLLSLKGFPLYDNQDPSRFMIPLTISPKKTNSAMMEMLADMAIKDNQAPLGYENPDLTAFLNSGYQDEEFNTQVEEVIRLMPGLDDFFPREASITTLEEIVEQARLKKAFTQKAVRSVEEFVEENKVQLAKSFAKVEDSEKMLSAINELVKSVGANFPQSNGILAKIRDNYRDLAANMSTIKLHYQHMLKITDDIKQNVFSYSVGTLKMLIKKIEDSKQILKTNMEKIGSNIQVIEVEAKAWITNTDRLKGIKDLGDAVNPYLHKLAIEIHRKKREVDYARGEYLKRKHIVMASKGDDFVWDDFAAEEARMKNIIDNMTSHMQIVREKYSNFCNAPIEILQSISAEKLIIELNYNKEEFEANKKRLMSTADTILNTAHELMGKVDLAEELHDSIFDKLNFLLMKNPAFMEKSRMGILGGGSPFLLKDGDNKQHFYPKRGVAMMEAIQGLDPTLDSDLKNKAILEAFLSVTPGFTLLRTQKTIDFYKILEQLKGTQKDFYHETKLKKINQALESFIEANKLTAQYQATKFVQNASPSAASVYGAIATKPEFEKGGDYHFWNVGDKGKFDLANQQNDQELENNAGKAKASEWEEKTQEEPTLKKDVFINSRKL
jgi:hypothetical protein